MTKRLWRKEAKKTVGEDGVVRRNGRQLKQMGLMQDYFFKNSPKTYPLLNALFDRVGLTPAAPVVAKEVINEVV